MYVSCRKVFHDRRILILTLTRLCNLRCKICPQRKNSQIIDPSTAKRAIELFIASFPNSNCLLIRFFGGEPLLVFKLLKRLLPFSICKAKENNKIIFFNMTTNALLLDKTKISFFKKIKNFELIINSYTLFKQKIHPSLFSLKNLSINIAIDPDFADRLAGIFYKLLETGFRSFNFLPSYFTYWNKTDLKNLNSEFKTIVNFLNRVDRSLKIHIKNKFNFSSIPLANQSINIDCNGDIYPNNLVFLKRFSSLKSIFRLGNVNKDHDLQKAFTHSAIFDYNKIFRDRLPKSILESNYKVDDMLSNFVNSLS